MPDIWRFLIMHFIVLLIRYSKTTVQRWSESWQITSIEWLPESLKQPEIQRLEGPFLDIHSELPNLTAGDILPHVSNMPLTMPYHAPDTRKACHSSAPSQALDIVWPMSGGEYRWNNPNIQEIKSTFPTEVMNFIYILFQKQDDICNFRLWVFLSLRKAPLQKKGLFNGGFFD